MERVAIAMSGGVDSSVAALILKNSGCDLVGFSLKFRDQETGLPGDLRDARAVAARLGIPFHVADLREEFEREIVRPFVEAYRGGLTPSPCVRCNSRMKFDRLFRLAGRVGAGRIATGHYARLGRDSSSGRFVLAEARDRNKDQSYFLFELTQDQLARALFPLGDLDKEEVRRIARAHDIPVAEKPESQEICFVPDGDYASFVEAHGAPGGAGGGSGTPGGGAVVDVDGRVLGRHRGLHRYTVGQRRGLGIAHREPLYVLELRPGDNAVVVGERALLGERRCRVIRPNWIAIPSLDGPLAVRARIRSRHEAAPAVITPLEDGGVEVVFDAPQPAVTPGQACVFYRDGAVVGGGWIRKSATGARPPEASGAAAEGR
jgi:tRNA-specific 2-thiouridylase